MASSRKRQATRGKNRRREEALHRAKAAGIVGLALAAAAGVGYLIYPRLAVHHGAHRAGRAAAQEIPAPAPAAASGAGHTGEAAAAAPRFDFYTMLPKLKVIVPRTEDASSPAPPASAAAAAAVPAAAAPGVYALQVGSFRALADADRVKAQLALMGVEADIYSIKADNGTWHRLVVGPFGNLHQLNKVAQRLQKNNVGYIVMKVKG